MSIFDRAGAALGKAEAGKARTAGKGSKNMKIIVVGAGKIGRALTERLYGEGHDITVVDINYEKIQTVTETYDVMGIVGNGATYSVLQDAGIDDADLLIAVTSVDELNLLCCTVGMRAGHCLAIARVRSPEYSNEINYLKDKLGLAMIINPEQETGNEIARMLSLPMALSVSPFAHGKVEMIRFCVPEGNVIAGKSLAEISRSINENVLVCAIERQNYIDIPDGSNVVQAGDMLTIIATQVEARRFFGHIHIRIDKIKDVMIIGGSKAAYYLGKRLIENGLGVKIIEKDLAHCEKLSEMLPDAIVIRGDGTDEDLLIEEGIERTDAFIPMTSMDEENILLTLHALEVTNAKVITKLKRNTFHEVVGKLELGSVIYPVYITAERITAYVRGMYEGFDNNNIVTLYHMFDGKMEGLEFDVRLSSKATGIPLKDLKLKENVLVAAILRNHVAIIPSGNDVILPGDAVIIVTMQKGFQQLDDILK